MEQAKQASEKYTEITRREDLGEFPHPTMGKVEPLVTLANLMCQGDMLLKLAKTYPSIQRLVVENCTKACYLGLPVKVYLASMVNQLWDFSDKSRKENYLKQALEKRM